MNLKRLHEWLDFLRSVAALLFMPVVSLGASAIIALLMIFFAGHPDPIVVQLVVRFLGYTLMGLVILLGFGLMWTQKRNLKISGTGPNGTGFSVDTDDDDPSTTVQTTTSVEIK